MSKSFTDKKVITENCPDFHLDPPKKKQKKKKQSLKKLKLLEFEMYKNISQIYNNLNKDQNCLHYLEMPLVPYMPLIPYFQDWVPNISFPFSFWKTREHPGVTLRKIP